MLPNTLPHDFPQEKGAFPPFESLYDQYHIQIYHYLYAHLKNEQDAADVMQQVFMQAWKQRQTYNPRRGTVVTWLFAIARHQLIDFSRMSRPSMLWEAIPEITSMDQNPENNVLFEETLAQVKKMLEALSQPEQELLALRFAAWLSSAEIASLVGKSEATTKKQLTRLLHRLQEQYRRDVLELLLPDLLEPALPAFLEALLQAYAVSLSSTRFSDIRQNLLKLAHPVSF